MTISRRLLSALLLIAAPSFAQKTQRLATIPYVSCPADGQVGPVHPNPHKPVRLSIPRVAAAQLAYYHSAFDTEGLGVLAPRGWHCFGTYGSSGQSLYVAPAPMSARDFFAKSPWKGISGPGIQLSIEEGGTSGRFGVAQAVVDVFPHHMQFVTNLIAGEKQIGGAPLDFKSQRGSSDIVQYKSNEVAEFSTPPNATGLGTSSWLHPNDDPIHGFMHRRRNQQPAYRRLPRKTLRSTCTRQR